MEHEKFDLDNLPLRNKSRTPFQAFLGWFPSGYEMFENHSKSRNGIFNFSKGVHPKNQKS